jgi:hypothetical protein
MVKPASKEQVSPLKPEEVVAAGIPVEDVKVQPVSMDIPKKVKKINNVLLQNDEPQKIKEADPEPTFEPRTENLMMVM